MEGIIITMLLHINNPQPNPQATQINVSRKCSECTKLSKILLQLLCQLNWPIIQAALSCQQLTAGIMRIMLPNPPTSKNAWIVLTTIPSP